MNKLERKLRKVDRLNDPGFGSVESFRAELLELGKWVYKRWAQNALRDDVCNVKRRNEK